MPKSDTRRLGEACSLHGHVRAFVHAPGYVYTRETYTLGSLVHDDHNAINSAGITYLLQMLLADVANEAAQPRKYGITMMGVSGGGAEKYKGDLTDQYVSGNGVRNILYVPTTSPAVQPVNLDAATLYLDTNGTVVLATANLTPFQKTASLGVTLEWTITLTGA